MFSFIFGSSEPLSLNLGVNSSVSRFQARHSLKATADMFQDHDSLDYQSLLKSLNASLHKNTTPLNQLRTALSSTCDSVSYTFTVGPNQRIVFHLVLREMFYISENGKVTRKLLQRLTMTGLPPLKQQSEMRPFDWFFVQQFVLFLESRIPAYLTDLIPSLTHQMFL